MGSDDRRVHDQPLQVGILQSLKNGLPRSLAAPPVEPSPDTVPLPETLRQITPRGTSLGQPQDGVNEQTVVLRCPPRLVRATWQQIFDPLPILIADRVSLWHDRPSLTTLEAALYSKRPDLVHTT